jgi:hypothetical protein
VRGAGRGAAGQGVVVRRLPEVQARAQRQARAAAVGATAGRATGAARLRLRQRRAARLQVVAALQDGCCQRACGLKVCTRGGPGEGAALSVRRRRARARCRPRACGRQPQARHPASPAAARRPSSRSRAAPARHLRSAASAQSAPPPLPPPARGASGTGCRHCAATQGGLPPSPPPPARASHRRRGHRGDSDESGTPAAAVATAGAAVSAPHAAAAPGARPMAPRLSVAWPRSRVGGGRGEPVVGRSADGASRRKPQRGGGARMARFATPGPEVTQARPEPASASPLGPAEPPARAAAEARGPARAALEKRGGQPRVKLAPSRARTPAAAHLRPS